MYAPAALILVSEIECDVICLSGSVCAPVQTYTHGQQLTVVRRGGSRQRLVELSQSSGTLQYFTVVVVTDVDEPTDSDQSSESRRNVSFRVTIWCTLWIANSVFETINTTTLLYATRRTNEHILFVFGTENSRRSVGTESSVSVSTRNNLPAEANFPPTPRPPTRVTRVSTTTVQYLRASANTSSVPFVSTNPGIRKALILKPRSLASPDLYPHVNTLPIVHGRHRCQVK